MKLQNNEKEWKAHVQVPNKLLNIFLDFTREHSP